MFGRGLQIAKIGGVRIILDPSLWIIFLLVLFQLGAGVLPGWHPDWRPVEIWTVAVATAFVFFASILLHELSHAVVGRAFGIEVRRITLFLFGGAADIERNPPSAKAELWMAIVGPITSIAIGLACLLGAGLLAAPTILGSDPLEAVARMGPVATVLAWAGPINILLGLFNLVPGFPLDGGRVLRAIAWMITGDLDRSTRVAVTGGKLVAGVLIMAGVAMALGFNLPVFGTGLLGGVWLALIGWFLHRAAAGSYEQLVIEHILDDVTVPEIMAHAVAIPASTTLAELVHEHLLSSDARAFPIVDEHMTLLGIVSLDDVRKVSRERWPTTRVIDAMTARERLLVADPHSRLPEILQRMLRRDVAQVPVVSDERLIGVIRRADLLRWLELQLPRPRPRRPDEYDEQRAAA